MTRSFIFFLLDNVLKSLIWFQNNVFQNNPIKNFFSGYDSGPYSITSQITEVKCYYVLNNSDFLVTLDRNNCQKNNFHLCFFG